MRRAGAGPEFVHYPAPDDLIPVTPSWIEELVIEAAVESMIEQELAEVLGRTVRGGIRRAHATRVPCPGLVRMSEVTPESVQWLWPSRIPAGRLTLLDGDPGLGKSTMTLDLAARVSTGSQMPDGTTGLNEPRGTVLLTAEDGLADTVRPRLDACGGDPDRIVALRWVDTRGAINGDPARRLPTVQDLFELDMAIREVGAALLIVDPLSAYLGPGVNAHRDADVRAGLAGLADLAERTGVAVVAVRHLRKANGGNPLYAGGGSIGLIAAARSALLLARDPDDENRLILASLKNNLAPRPPSLALRVVEVSTGGTRISWQGETDHDAGELLEWDKRNGRSKREVAKDLLRTQLANGPAKVEKLRQVAEEVGIGWRTMEEAKRRLEIESVRSGFGRGAGWSWRLSNIRRNEGCGLNPAQATAAYENVARECEDPALAPPIGRKSGAVTVYEAEQGSSDPSDDVACADCGTLVPPNPAFAFPRCFPCALEAGKQERLQGR